MKLTIVTQDAKREVDIQGSNSDITLFPLSNVTEASASRELRIPFSYGVVNPFELWVGTGFVRSVAIAIVEPFPSGTQLSVGTSADPDLLFSAGAIDPAAEGEYVVNNWTLFETSMTLQLTLSLPPGSSQGKGFVVLSL